MKLTCFDIWSVPCKSAFQHSCIFQVQGVFFAESWSTRGLDNVNQVATCFDMSVKIKSCGGPIVTQVPICLNPLMTNGFSHTYHLDDSVFIFKGIGSDFSFLCHFSMKIMSANLE